MTDTLRTRAIELPTQAQLFTYGTDPLATDLQYQFGQPTAIEASVGDTGMFRNRTGVNRITMATTWDAAGNPLEEVVASTDSGTEFTTRWVYTSQGYLATIAIKGEPEAQASAIAQESGNVLYVKGQETFLLTKEALPADGTLHRLIDHRGCELETATYDTNGKIIAATRRDTKVLFAYDEHGRLVRQTADHSRITFDGEPQPAITEYDNSRWPGQVAIQGTDAGVLTLNEERIYDDHQRPIMIDSTTGAYDVERTRIVTEITY